MGIDVGRARRALKAAGAGGSALCAAAWPFGRERRLRILARRRLATLEAKNRVVEFLFRTQKPLADFHLFNLERVESLLKDPEKRKLIIGMSVSQEVIEEELTSRSGAEVGQALDQALSELIAEGVLLRVPGKTVMSREDVFLAVQRGRRPHYDVSELNRLVRQSGSYGRDLRSRARREASTTSERSYDL
jgi:hypothetical protein